MIMCGWAGLDERLECRFGTCLVQRGRNNNKINPALAYQDYLKLRWLSTWEGLINGTVKIVLLYKSVLQQIHQVFFLLDKWIPSPAVDVQVFKARMKCSSFHRYSILDSFRVLKHSWPFLVVPWYSNKIRS